MKKRIRMTLSFLCLLTLLFALPGMTLSVAAETEAEGQAETYTAPADGADTSDGIAAPLSEEGQPVADMPAVSAADNTQNSASPSPADPAAPSDGQNPTDAVAQAGGSAEKTTFSGLLVRFFGDNCAELLSGLTLVSSLCIALLFKKGLLPALASALKGVAGQVDRGMEEMNAAGQKLTGAAGQAMQRFTAAVSPTMEKMALVADRAEEMADRLTELEAALRQSDDSRTRAETVLRAQMDMFYRFFMSVNLPQYQKDALGETYAKINTLLGGEVPHEDPQSEG